jgi:hypothetical protein
VAIALILDVSMADLFTPPAEIGGVQVDSQRFPRERLLTQGEKDGERLYEIAPPYSGTRAINQRYSPSGASAAVGDREHRTRFAWKAADRRAAATVRTCATPGHTGRHPLERRDYEERAQEWYDAVASVPSTEAVEADE